MIGLSTSMQLSHLRRQLAQEVLRIGPILDSVRPRQIFRSNSLEEGGDVIGGVGEMLDSYDSLEDLLRLGLSSGRRNDSGTVDEVDSTHERDVLPHLRLSRDRRSLADGLLLERVDD